MERNVIEIHHHDVKELVRNRITVKELANKLFPNATSDVSAATCLYYWLGKGVMPVEMYQRMLKIVEGTPLNPENTVKHRKPTESPFSERNEAMYNQWVEGKRVSEIAEEYGITITRVTDLCRRTARRKYTDSWDWMSQFKGNALALFIRNNIRCEEDLHAWWGEGKPLRGTFISLAEINKHLGTPLVYAKRKRVNKNLIDLTGQRFGRLTVIKRAENKSGDTRWECLCDCGKTTVVRSQYLRGGNTKSCGCLANEYRHSITTNGIHGMAKVVKCHTCRHFNELTRKCEAWSAATVPNGYCYKGEKREV